MIFNAVQFDITEQQEAEERLRVSEEENRLAISHSGNIVTKFVVSDRTLSLPSNLNEIFDLPPILNNMPDEQINLGRVSHETAGEYIKLFEGIVHGSPEGTVTFQQNSTIGWRWLKAQYTTVFSDFNEPVSAVITFADITEQLEKDVVYNKWQQSLNERPKDTYTLLRCNLSRGAACDSCEGELLSQTFDNRDKTFSEHTSEYAWHSVCEEDRKSYLSFMSVDTMLSAYYHGHRSDSIEYREIIDSTGEFRWIKLSADLVEYPNSKDIEAYFMFEDIDERKKEELRTKERAEVDALTGAVNRETFVSRFWFYFTFCVKSK